MVAPLPGTGGEAVVSVKIRHLVFFFGLLLVIAQLAVDHGWGSSFNEDDEGGSSIRSLRQEDAAVHSEELIDLKNQLESLAQELASVKGDKQKQDKDQDLTGLKNQLESLKQELASVKGSSQKQDESSSNELKALRKDLESLKANKSNEPEPAKGNEAAAVEPAKPQTVVEIEAEPEPDTPWAKPHAKREFGKPYDKVVIATKIHGQHQLFILKQMLCLFTFAYNDRMKYDVIVFTTIPLEEKDVKDLEALGLPAKVSVVVDNPGLHVMVDNLEPDRKEKFLNRCNVTKTADLNWHSVCFEPDGTWQKLAYNWQAEFRSLHLWNHPALTNYRYMFWIDADGFSSEVWKRDPVAYFIENNLVMFFNNFGQGKSAGRVKEFRERFQAAFNKTVTNLRVEEGHLAADEGLGPIHQIHGFLHITDLDWFRSEPVMKWLRILIGDEFLVRRFCDQLAVTGATAVLAPERSWDMRSHGIKLNVFHNGQFDGKEYSQTHFKKYWHERGGKEKFPVAAQETCEVTAAG
ncbi:expressed unknown protein [Seminavis robusta]|uniref:Uncharacterized protein n=1 Tax=Seminavis robusta TaxID=568900 RepID=A0A9N8E429_9STRA|nr:expressed unknown protein [Seminavis robusta]|eukprot:Sro503_g155820.1 n/a (520) ;mRNA; r:29841-31400